MSKHCTDRAILTVNLVAILRNSFTFSLHMRKVKQLAQGHERSKQQGQASNSGFITTKDIHLFICKKKKKKCLYTYTTGDKHSNVPINVQRTSCQGGECQRCLTSTPLAAGLLAQTNTSCKGHLAMPLKLLNTVLNKFLRETESQITKGKTFSFCLKD